MTIRPIGDALPDALARVRAKFVPADAELELEGGPVDLLDLTPPEEHLAGLRRARWATMVPSRFAWAELPQLDDKVRPVIADWAANPAGRNLVLLGPVGTGKTHAALAAARERALAGDVVRFYPVVELLDHLRPSGPEGTYGHLADLDLLVVDDLGTERATDWTDERLGALINRRWMEERPTIVTTNLEGPALLAALGERAYSRLTGSGTVALRLTGQDRRRA